MSRFVRVGSPEKHGRRWRVVQIDALGRREHRYFEGEQAETLARAFVLAFRSAAQERTLAVAVAEYLDHLARHGGAKRRPLKPSTLRVVRSKLEGILQLVDPAARKGYRGAKRPEHVQIADRALRTLTPTACQRLYDERVRATKSNGAPITADTHRSELIYASAFGDWCAEQGWITANPFATVLPEGQTSKGKEQLRVDEARAFLLAAYSDTHPLGGIAAAGVLTLGVRASELLDRRVRDLDDGGRVLWITEGKTESSKRRVAVPPVLREALARLALGQGPEARLFGTMTTNTLLGHVRRLAEIARVPEICTHGLRGTQISLTVEVGALVEAASKGAGHAGTGVTRAHYLAAGVEQSARAKLMEDILLATPDAAEEARKLAEAEAEVLAAQAKLDSMRKRPHAN